MKVINLFSGCGGCSLGLKNAGFEICLAVDIDKDACNTYTNNLGKEAWCTDLSNIKTNALLEQAKLNLGDVDVIVGGPPCQGFSSAGAKDWTDPRNALIRSFVSIITSLRPTWFIMENVEGLLTANGGIFLIEAISHFLQAGYWVRTKKIYMERYGLPQSRKRVVIVGNLEQRNFDFPQETHFEYPALPTMEYFTQLDIMDAISDLPNVSETGVVFYDKEAQCDYKEDYDERMS